MRIGGSAARDWAPLAHPARTAHVAIQVEARGPNSTVMTDWAAGLQAIGEGADWIRAGEADAVLAGGADTGLLPHAWAGFEQRGLFDVARGGAFVPGEGAAVLLLEEAESARRRGAPVLGEIVAHASAAGPAVSGVATLGVVLRETLGLSG